MCVFSNTDIDKSCAYKSKIIYKHVNEIKKYFRLYQNYCDKINNLSKSFIYNDLNKTIDLIKNVKKSKIILFGNGGSS